MEKVPHVCEMTVSLKGEESSFKQKFLIYDEIVMSPQHPVVERCIKEAMENFKLKPDIVKIRVNMEI